MPSSSHSTSPSNSTGNSSSSRWRERLRLRFRRRQYTSLSPDGSTPSPSNASTQTGSETRHHADDTNSRLEEDIWVDRDTLNSQELLESNEGHSKDLHRKDEDALPENLTVNKMTCVEGAVEEDQSQRSKLTQTQQAAQKEDRDHAEEQQSEPHPNSTSPPHPPIPNRKPYRCRICGTTYYAQSQTRGLCYICACTLSL